MAIDDPVGALASQLDAEDRTDSAMTSVVVAAGRLVDLIPVPDLFWEAVKSGIKAGGVFLEQQKAARREMLENLLVEEFQRLSARVEVIDEARRSFNAEVFIPLVVDGLQKAEMTREESRIRRIAAILAHACEVGTPEAADIAEEMMRVAMILTDEDVLVLRVIYQGLAPSYNMVRHEVDFNRANDFWRLLDPTHRSSGEPEILQLNSLSAGQLKGTCGKLQSLGLLAQVERQNSKVSPDINVYTIIKRTKDFVEYISSAA